MCKYGKSISFDFSGKMMNGSLLHTNNMPYYQKWDIKWSNQININHVSSFYKLSISKNSLNWTERKREREREREKRDRERVRWEGIMLRKTPYDFSSRFQVFSPANNEILLQSQNSLQSIFLQKLLKNRH